MKRTPLPASVFYNALERFGPMTFDDFGLASRSHTIRMICELRAAGLVHVCGWMQGEAGRWRMVVDIGNQLDAPIPCRTVEEQRALDTQRRRARKEAMRQKPPAPTLPTYTPRIGIWGI